MNTKRSAFTLVELAIVIVIIGLITGGVLGAQSLIRSSKVSAAIQEITKMDTAIKAFQLEYDETPGLLKDAYDYWGSDCSPGNHADNIYVGCNGDYEDNCVDISVGNCVVSTSMINDVRRLPVHLVLSGIHPELKYITDSRNNSNCDEHYNTSEIGSKYWVSSEDPNKLYMYFFDVEGVSHNGSMCTGGTFVDSLSPRDVKKIDEKLDDGNGIRGIVRAVASASDDSLSGTDCVSTTGVYNLSADDKTCNLRAELQ